jgi:hypothetical protein
MPAKKGAAKAPKPVPFAETAAKDYPFETYATEGKRMHAKLKLQKPKKGLNNYEAYLVNKHFPIQETKYCAARAQDELLRRKRVRRKQANGGLAGNSRSNSSDSDASPVFKRKSGKTQKVQVGCLSNRYFP